MPQSVRKNLKLLSCNVGDISFIGVFGEGFWRHNGVYYHPHIHTQYEMHVVVDGEYILEDLENKKAKRLSRGSVVLIPPGYYHNARTGTDGQVIKYDLRLEISQNKKQREGKAIYQKFMKELQGLGNNISDIPLPRALECLDGIYQCLGEDGDGSELMAEAYFNMLMTRWVVMLLKHGEVDEKKENHPSDSNTTFVRKEIIESFLEENMTNPKLDAQMLADRVNLSVRQTNRIVMEFYGVSFRQLLTDMRMAYARKILLNTKMTAKEIAAQVGYESATGLFVAFKKKYGITPGEFRAKNKKI